MAPVLVRLKRRADFRRATRARNSAAAPGLVLQARALSETDAAEAAREAGLPADRAADMIRVGFTASRKVGNAVKRNRAKRRSRALADEVLRAQARPGTDYVLIARAATAERPFGKLRGDLLSALKRLGRSREDRGREASSGFPPE